MRDCGVGRRGGEGDQVESGRRGCGAGGSSGRRGRGPGESARRGMDHGVRGRKGAGGRSEPPAGGRPTMKRGARSVQFGARAQGFRAPATNPGETAQLSQIDIAQTTKLYSLGITPDQQPTGEAWAREVKMWKPQRGELRVGDRLILTPPPPPGPQLAMWGPDVMTTAVRYATVREVRADGVLLGISVDPDGNQAVGVWPLPWGRSAIARGTWQVSRLF